ncbi:MAG: hypothetical protein DYG83_07975 [Candidatus Brocadia sp. AMX2]|nr:MAG: hypothetical protein EDM70_09150 [Candidatus Brocadia sp. AMX2]MBC6932361.1 hypothetical protein [Candidatus Brocadia sp.]MBL1169823.1 hypothetical protein [Candidatus Brocadia sp. AMX1]MCE7866750.1 hypothetical protein [Candidatus Brocadia sp. AMX2]MCQ3917456.1 hypothetical protein [Candidatus Brocadia sp.]
MGFLILLCTNNSDGKIYEAFFKIKKFSIILRHSLFLVRYWNPYKKIVQSFCIAYLIRFRYSNKPDTINFIGKKTNDGR